jgi:hypothetical protein
VGAQHLLRARPGSGENLKTRGGRTGAILALTYLGLYLLSWIYAVGFLLFNRPPAEFNPPSLVALPWTFFIIPVANSWGIQDWYGRHVGSPALYGTVMALLFAPGVLLNAIIVYLFGTFLGGRRRA